MDSTMRNNFFGLDSFYRDILVNVFNPINEGRRNIDFSCGHG